MAIAFDASALASDSVTSPLTWSHTVGAGANRMLVVLLAIQGATQGTVTAVTYNSVAMTKATSVQNHVTGFGFNEVSAWILPNPTSGAHTISATATIPTSPDFNGASISYTGVNQSTTPDAVGTGNGIAAGAASASITTVATGAWIAGIMNFMNNGASSGSITSSQTIRQAASMAANVNGRYSAVDTNATVTPGANSLSFTSTAGSGATTEVWGIAAVSLAPAGGNSQSFTASLTPSGSLNKSTKRTVTASLTPSGSIKRRAARALTATMGSVGSLARSAGKKLSASLTPTGSIIRATGHKMTASLVPTGSLIRTTAHRFTASLTPAGSLSKARRVTLSASVGFTGSMARRISHSFTASLSLIGTFISMIPPKFVPLTVTVTSIFNKVFDQDNSNIAEVSTGATMETAQSDTNKSGIASETNKTDVSSEETKSTVD